MKKLFIIFLLSSFVTNTFSQNQFLDEIYLQDKYRNLQIAGDSNIINSFLFRSTFQFQEITNKYNKIKSKISIFNSEDIQYNSLLPINYNDGNMYPARGWQTRYTIGMHYYSQLFDFNLQPEFIKNQNKQQEYYAGNINDGNFVARYFGYVANNIDNFRQFGTKSIDTITWGQSRIGLKFKSISIGISNQNYWVGPGKRNSLTMTNNAAGFKHYYLSSNKPINTPIGNVEFIYVKGILDTLKYKDPDVGLLSGWPAGIANKYLYKREFQHFSFTWSPKWTRGLFIGYSQTKQNYISNTVINDDEVYKRLDSYYQELGSIFFRLVLPKEKAELYGEFGFPDSKPNINRFFSDNPKTGIIIGATKVLSLSKKNQYINLNFELAQLQLMDSRTLFKMGQPFNGNPINSWYTNTRIQQGYTNEAQIMGASIGPGSNSQTFNISWRNSTFKIGSQLERIAINNDFYFIQYYIGKNSPGENGKGAGYYNRYWVDLNTIFFAEYSVADRLYIIANYTQTNSMNYRWIRNEDGSPWNKPSSLSDKYNNRISLSLRINIH